MSGILSLVALLSFAPIAPDPADAAGDAVDIEVVVQWQTSDWGPLERGLQARVRGPLEIEQGEQLKLAVELRGSPEWLDPGVKQLNAFLRDAHLELFLTDPDGQSWTVKPYDPTAGLPAIDTGEATVPLDGAGLKPWDAAFPLLRLYETLRPGAYVARVRFSFPESPTSHWHETEAEWKAAGFWHGTVQSGPFSLRILPETPKTRALLVPARLRLRKELVRRRADDAEQIAVPAVYFDRRDAEAVEVPVRNGHFVAAWYFRNGEQSALTGPPQPNNVNSIDTWRDYEGGGREISYTIEVFETADRPVHLWRPGPRSGGYKVLWKKTYKFDMTEDEIRKAAGL